MFCKHKWSKITETTTKSKMELLSDVLEYAEGIPSSFVERKYICILQCEKCGKLDKTILTI
jgi:hypothetical protein